MRGTEEVDIGLLHQTDVLLVGGIVDIAPRLRMMVVTVHATQFHVLSVDFKHLADNLHLLHTQMVVEVLNYAVVLVSQFDAEGI